VRIGFEASGQLDGKQNLILDTELVRYKWTSLDGTFPDWQKLIPTEFNASVSFDAIEAIKAVSSLKVLADSKSYPIDLTIGNGKVVMANPDDKGQAEINADTQGEGMRVRLDGKYLAEALRACGGMVELKLTNSYSPMLYAVNGYQLVVMPMATNQSAEDMKRDKKVEAQAEPSGEAEAEPTAEAEGTTEGEPEADKPKRKRKVKEPVGV
jgi:DNA polymerase III sliding clamp (beta) subunit (PCNA family)